ncbi:DUF5067 domain-containing protein [Ligilactobacillus apodemi]|uniref:DUF5067 domain-containing protein n=1 Tax=Ligilactobacillus apodemi DSM 16634 = JCM 16172 TaxID=1423724 RepID=A0A0R1TWJ0_9LACO|nr:DUF5067 domain-containing protein [Ligilactobacillus apodemi]KRL84580.1 hypothetical protein FC32_GL000471 [Ligilactobacillus apodemi DSM 16634 = JCM 16172]
MKKVSILFVCIVCSILAGCSSTDKVDKNSVSSSDKTVSTSTQSQKGFNGKTLKNEDGSLTITKVETTKTTNPSIEGEVKAVLIIGKFTNNSSETQSPKDFWSQYIKVYTVNKNSDSELILSGLQIDTPYDDLYEAASDKVHPGKTIKFMIGYQTNKLSTKYKFVPTTKSSDELKPTLTLNAKNIDVSSLNNGSESKSTASSESTSTSTPQENSTEIDSTSSSSSTTQTSNSYADLPPFDGTLSDFINKYGVTPAVYKVQKFGMSPEEALKSTPDELETSGEIQTEAGY